MAYISKEEAKIMKEALKYVFPSKEGWKVGFRRENSSKASITLFKGLFEIEGSGQDRQLNSYSRSRNNDPQEIFRDLVSDTLELAVANYDNSDIQTDYFDVGYYKSIRIGSYEKPYSYNPKNELDWDKVRGRLKKFAIRKELKYAS
jgi:hypothetical protein